MKQTIVVGEDIDALLAEDLSTPNHPHNILGLLNALDGVGAA